MKWPAKKPVRYGNTKICFALKSKAEKLWKLGRSYQRKRNQDAADNCFALAKETAKEADKIANQPHKNQ